MSTCRIQHLVFWAGGVVLTPPRQAVWEALAPGRTPDPRAAHGLHRLEQALADGSLSPEEFCRRAAEIAGVAAPADALSRRLPEHITAVAGMPEVIAGLAGRSALSLASDYPRRWLEPALERAGLARLFGGERAWIVAEWGGFPRALEAWIEAGRIAPGRALWVDHHSLRTSAALRRGVDAAVFVHARQFYRDLGLWGLVPSGGGSTGARRSSSPA